MNNHTLQLVEENIAVPAHLIPYLVYGETDTLSDSEQSEADHYMWDIEATYGAKAPYIDVIGEYTEFDIKPAIGLPCDTVTCNVYAYVHNSELGIRS